MRNAVQFTLYLRIKFLLLEPFKYFVIISEIKRTRTIVLSNLPLILSISHLN
jgi:hypothetical protein